MRGEFRVDRGDATGRRLGAAVLASLFLLSVVGFYVATGRREGVREAETPPAVTGAAGPERPPPGPPPSPDTPRVFDGKVVRVDPSRRSLALEADDASRRPIAEDDGSRMLFLDRRLQDRPVRLSAVATPGTGALRVVCVQTIDGGRVFDVDYWCETCQISLSCPGPCFCCGEGTALRARPAR